MFGLNVIFFNTKKIYGLVSYTQSCVSFYVLRKKIQKKIIEF